MDVVIGLDVGTSGAKAIAVSADGSVAARASTRFENLPGAPQPGWAEQDAHEWWKAARLCLAELTLQLGEHEIVAICTDSTSGTIVPVNKAGTPLMNAMMYNDARGKGLEAQVNDAAGDFTERLGYRFPPAFALVKLLWLQQNRPDIVEQTHRFVHAADYLAGMLTGSFDATDTSNALKTGVDLLTGEFPPFIEDKLGIPLDKFPKVYRPGEKIGEVSADAGEETGVPAGTPVIAGATDGTASFLASGAKSVGDWNLNIGTTISIRGIAQDLVRDPQGRIYCHRHPEGFWLPGGASNVGGEALQQTFGGETIADYDPRAGGKIPTSLLVYPLIRQSERMPFVSQSAEGFVDGDPADELERFAGYVEGIGMVTVWSLQAAAELGASIEGELFLAGGAVQGKTLGRVIASLMEKPLTIASEPEAAMGVAALAAGYAWHKGAVSKAQAAMIGSSGTIDPVREWSVPLQDKLAALKAAVAKRGFITV